MTLPGQTTNNRGTTIDLRKQLPRSAQLADLPPEVWDQIAQYIPTASSISNLGQTSKAFATFVERDGWKIFSRTRFPSLCSGQTCAEDSWRNTARNLTSTSRAWDRRAIVARYLEPSGEIYTFPGPKRQDGWRRPQGQTMGFTPHLGVYEEGDASGFRNETLAFSAGAEICVRLTRKHKGTDNVRWLIHRPPSLSEGIDDVTTLHLFSPNADLGFEQQIGEIRLIKGTAKGDLQLLRIPTDGDGRDVQINDFATQGAPVRNASTYVSDSSQPTLLAASLGESNISVYSIDTPHQRIAASDQIDIKAHRASGSTALQNSGIVRSLRTWCTTFLSPTSLAVGVGPSESPIRIYSLNQSGISHQPVRELSLIDTGGAAVGEEKMMPSLSKKPLSSVYTIVPLPSSTARSSPDGNIFLSGAYDGVVRLHDLRSPRDSEQAYIDPTNDNPIYSLLPRGQERFLAGTSRHNLLKVFDLRLGARCYDYLEARADLQDAKMDLSSPDFNLYLRTNTGRTRRRRVADSSVYSLAAASASSPRIYAGMENSVIGLEMASMTDAHVGNASALGRRPPRDVHRLAMHEHVPNFRMMTQCDQLAPGRQITSKRTNGEWILDERWIDAAEMNGGRW